MSNDLLEISYLSKFVNGVIVGKNSGPYTYTHTKANILNPSKHYVCFSKNETDTLNHGLDCPAKFAFSNTLNDIDAAYLINQSIKQSKEII